MNHFIKEINKLKKTKIKEIINKKIKQFSLIKKKNNKTIFKELCFCILTANYDAEKAISIQNKINNDFITLSERKLSQKLSILGYRYPNVRAKYIVYNRKYIDTLKDILKTLKNEELRLWFVKNIKGISYKEASHFLRNIGYNEYAIIDFHIIDILYKNKYIKNKFKTLNQKKYLDIEKILKNLAKKVNLNLGQLDFYLWYMETGKILK